VQTKQRGPGGIAVRPGSPISVQFVLVNMSWTCTVVSSREPHSQRFLLKETSSFVLFMTGTVSRNRLSYGSL
jgi:hypothetical protein